MHVLFLHHITEPQNKARKRFKVFSSSLKKLSTVFLFGFVFQRDEMKMKLFMSVFMHFLCLGHSKDEVSDISCVAGFHFVFSFFAQKFSWDISMTVKVQTFPDPRIECNCES